MPFLPEAASNVCMMRNPSRTVAGQVAGIAVLILISLVAFTTAKGKETIEVQVVSSKTRIHGSSPGNVFTYTGFLYTRVNGKNVLYECNQRGDNCPLMESGKTYSADREGNFIYISMSLPDDKRTISVKYRLIGSW
jgi:hypothetical protein